MYRMFSWGVFFCAFIAAEHTTGSSSPLAIDAPTIKPTIGDIFEVKVEGIFKTQNVAVEGTLSFDKKNNVAAMDMVWENNRKRDIYNFDTNELISIQGYECEVVNIPDEPGGSFFPYTVDPITSRKILAPSEEALYFTNSTYARESYVDDIPSYEYQGYVAVPKYGRTNCSVLHRFSKPDFESPTCEDANCTPILLAISVSCPEIPDQWEAVEIVYKFFYFRNTIEDQSVFHPPPGVFCQIIHTKSFPTLPAYFSFTYDIFKSQVNDDASNTVVDTLHKKVWYDTDLELVRVDGYNTYGLLQDIHIYDFKNKISYINFLQLNETGKSNLTEVEKLETITLLPIEVFPQPIELNKMPVHMGPRKFHGLNYQVWSTKETIPEEDYHVITEMFFSPVIRSADAQTDITNLQLSYLETFIYSPNEETSKMELSATTFIPINNFRSLPRDWSIFDLSPFFAKEEKRVFVLRVKGPRIVIGSSSYSDFMEQLYLEIVTAASISVTRIAKIQILPSDYSNAEDIMMFAGIILENPNKLGFGKQTNESDLNSAFKTLEEIINQEKIEFTISNINGDSQLYLVDSFKQLKGQVDGKCDHKYCYSGSSIAGIGLMMLIFGLIFGICSPFVFNKTRKIFRKEVVHKVSFDGFLTERKP